MVGAGRGKLIGKPPSFADVKLGYYCTGLFNGEGYSYVKRRRGRQPSPTIAITMCDLDALAPASEWWGLPIRKRGGRAGSCADGEAYRIEASGLRARLLMAGMKECGLSRRKSNQWEKVLIRAEKEAVDKPG